MIIWGKVRGNNPLCVKTQWCSLQREHVKEPVPIKFLSLEEVSLFILVSFTLGQEFITNQKLSLFSLSSKHSTNLPKERYLATNLLLLRELLENIKGFPPLSFNLLAASRAHIFVQKHAHSFQLWSFTYASDLIFYNEEINVYVIEIRKPKSTSQGIKEEVLKGCGRGGRAFERESLLCFVTVNKVVLFLLCKQL